MSLGLTKLPSKDCRLSNKIPRSRHEKPQIVGQGNPKDSQNNISYCCCSIAPRKCKSLLLKTTHTLDTRLI